MKRWILPLVVSLVAVPLFAVAGQLVTNDGSFAPASGLTVAIASATGGWTYAAVSASGNTVVKASPGTLEGIINESTSAQTTTCTLYDNATTNTGTVLYTEANIAAGQVVTFGSTAGMAATAGITVNCTGTTTTLMVLYK